MKKQIKNKILIGQVVTPLKDKTLKVRVSEVKRHPLYLKKYTITKNYLVSAEKDVPVGQKVKIISVKPISKKKTWELLEG